MIKQTSNKGQVDAFSGATESDNPLEAKSDNPLLEAKRIGCISKRNVVFVAVVVLFAAIAVGVSMGVLGSRSSSHESAPAFSTNETDSMIPTEAPTSWSRIC